MTQRIQEARNRFWKETQLTPNALVIHPEHQYQLQQEMFDKGVFHGNAEYPMRFPQYNGMTIYISTDVTDFRVGHFA